MDNMGNVQSVRIKEYLYSKAAHDGIPLSVTFELSPLCNFSCRMCYIHQAEEQVRKNLRKMVTCEEWIRIAEELRKEGTLYVLLTGGEPLLWPDFWKLYENLYRMGFLISVNTNGSLIDSLVVERFCKMPPNQINITLYGASDKTYSDLCGVGSACRKVMEAIELLQNNGIIVRLNCSLTPQNVSDLDQIFDYAEAHRLPILASTYMYPPVRKNQDMIGKNSRFTPEEAAAYRMKILKRQFMDESYGNVLRSIADGNIEIIGLDTECIDPQDGLIRCYAGKASCWMTWDGYLSLCGMIPDYYVDLKTNSFSKAWEELKQIAGDIRLSGKCAKCDYQNLCHSCAAKAYAETGKTSEVPEYLCNEVMEMRRISAHELKYTVSEMQ